MDSISLFDLIKWSPLDLLIPLLVVQRLLEVRRSKRNEGKLRARGAIEVGMNHYPAIVSLHVLWFVGIIAEKVILSRPINPYWPALLVLFLMGQALRLWAIRSLGDRWNTRILVLPGDRAVRRGPYQYLKHPNYLAVIIELVSFPLIYSAYVTAFTVTILNAILLAIRIRTEEDALREFAKGYERVGKSG